MCFLCGRTRTRRVWSRGRALTVRFVTPERACDIAVFRASHYLEANKAREEFLECYYFDLPDGDFSLAMRAYEWPKKMITSMKEATAAANAEHRAFEDALKKRRTTFQANLLILNYKP